MDAWAVPVRTRIAVVLAASPLPAVAQQFLVWSGIELDQGLADDRDIFPLAPFHVHQGSERKATDLPLLGRAGEIGHRGHVTGQSMPEKGASRPEQGQEICECCCCCC